MTNVPAFIYTALKDNLWHSFFAIKLDSIAAFDPSSGSHKEFAFELLNRQIDFINTLDCPEDGRSINLRFICRPDAAIYRGSIDASVLIGVSDSVKAQSIEKAASVYKDAWPAITSISECYEFEPVADEKEFLRIYDPFDIKSVAEILRREDVIEAQSSKRVRGFSATPGGKPSTMSTTGLIHYVYPFIWGTNAMSRVFKTMLNLDMPSMLSVILKPVKFTDEIDTLFRRQINEVEKHKQMPGYGSDPLLNAISKNLHSQLLRLEDSPFFVKIMIVSANAISKGLIDAFGVDLTEHAGSPDIVREANDAYIFSGGYRWHIFEKDDDFGKALDDLKWLTVGAHAPSTAPDGYRDIRHLFDSTQANCAFRFPVPQIKEIAGLKTRFSKNVLPPANLPDEGILLGHSRREGVTRDIRISRDDRRKHMYAVGQTGTGKSTLLLNMILQDIENNEGVAVLDPHGELVDEVLLRLPKHRVDDVIYVNFADVERPIALNMLECKTSLEKDMCVQQLFEIFEKLYDLEKTGGPIFEMYMKNALYLLLDDASTSPTLIDVQRLFADRKFREDKKSKASNKYIVDFWNRIAEEAGGEMSLSNMSPYIISKLSMFIYNNTVRNIIASQKSSIDFRGVMDDGKILLVDLSKGAIGATNSNFLGMVIVSKLLIAALGRGDAQDKDALRDFYLYIDEFQNLATDSFITLLSEARKYRLNAILANQYLTQIPKEVLASIFGNVGSTVAFRLGITDCEILEKEFYPTFTKNDMANLPNWNVCVKMLAKGAVLRPFVMQTNPAMGDVSADVRKEVVAYSRLAYGRDAGLIEEEIKNGGKQIEAHEKEGFE